MRRPSILPKAIHCLTIVLDIVRRYIIDQCGNSSQRPGRNEALYDAVLVKSLRTFHMGVFTYLALALQVAVRKWVEYVIRRFQSVPSSVSVRWGVVLTLTLSTI